MIEKQLYGVAAAFNDPDDLVKAVREVKKAGFTKLEAFTPFPMHAIDEALELPKSKLGYFVIVGGLTGTALALLIQWWTGAGDPQLFPTWTGLAAYPLMVGGKPPFAFEPSIPITFELTVLLAAFTTVFGMLGLNGLPRLYHPIFNFRNANRISDDQFVLVIERTDPKFDAIEATRLMRSLEADTVEVVEA
jgi:hypothetical protein